MVNEHHATSTCTNAVVPLSMAIVARETQTARILALGNPLAHRADPVRVAEEMATVDVISQGRADVGFVRGIPQEVIAVNSSAIDMRSRFWEAVDLIVQAWTTHDGPFNWEGEHFHHRQVNIWPRPYQQPHPPIWMPTTSTSSAKEYARRGYTVATLATGTRGCADIFAAYRDQITKEGGPAAPLDRFAYSPMIFVGDTNAEGVAEARKLQAWFREAIRHPFHYGNPPGYLEPPIRAQLMKAVAQGTNPRAVGKRLGGMTMQKMADSSVEELAAGGYMLAGNADTVFGQLRDLFDGVGGFGNVLMMAQYGDMSADLAVRSMTRWTNDVLPRFINEVYEPTVKGQRELTTAAANAS
jgi:alkanesulfonate monooxygenase SsuD/methylene tetrahydromethanopterin reductase-like flavin-dependent oxidoreductase (luciferase family)